MLQLMKGVGEKLIHGFGIGFGMTTAFNILGKSEVQHHKSMTPKKIKMKNKNN